MPDRIILVTEPDDLKAPVGAYRIIAQNAAGQQQIIVDYFQLRLARLTLRMLRDQSDDTFTLYDDQGAEIFV